MSHRPLALLAGGLLVLPAAQSATSEVSTTTTSPLVLQAFGPWTFPSRTVDVSRLLPAARRAVATQHDAFSRARALDDIVRQAYPPGTTCDYLASAVYRLGLATHQQLRIVVGSANVYTWAYDSHTTIEVWLPKQQRWVIADPTYDGYFTQGARGRKLAALDVNQLVTSGRAAEVYWHGSTVKNAEAPSASWLDLRAYFKTVAVVGADSGSFYYLVKDPKTAVNVGAHLAQATSSLVRGPDVKITGTRTPRPPLPALTHPPGTLLWRGTLQLDPKKEIPLPQVKARSVFVLASKPFLFVSPAYPAGPGRYVSPVEWTSGAKIRALFDPAPDTKVEIYSAPLFPKDHETLDGTSPMFVR